MRSTALTNGKYAVQLTESGKLVVNGGLLESLNYAVEEIERGIERWGLQTQGSMQLPDTVLNLTYVAPIFEFMLTFGTATLRQVIGNGGQSYMLYFENAKAVDISLYYSHLIENGFRGIEEPRLMLDFSSGFYAMCSNGDVMATMVLTTNNEEARVFVEKIEDNGYYSYVNDNTEKVCDPLFIQVGTGQLHGQCEIFRFANGDFFIVDGGLNDASEAYAAVQNCQRIVEILKTYAPDPQNICIVGWLLTHVHEDHTGAFSYFCENYADDPSIRIENILFNNYSDVVVQEKASDATWVVPLIHRVEAQIRAYADKTGASIHKTHPGQILYFGDAKLEIIYTHELRICSSNLTSINGLSIVSRFTVEGQTFLITGDTTTNSNYVMEGIYGNALKSDFYQTPHHGYGGNSTTLAERVNPRWVLWPCNQERYEEVRVKTHNEHLFDTARNRVEGHFLAEFKTYVFQLPFDGTNYTVTQNEKIG
jgi:glyoxylase-like metal-dependent hydrolase (beta-lactamase superfamily II)